MSIAENYRGPPIGANMSHILTKMITSTMKEGHERHVCMHVYFSQNTTIKYQNTINLFKKKKI